MKAKKLLWIALIAVATSLAYAATMVGKVTGSAIQYTDEQGAQCCDRITVPQAASTDLMNACHAMGGTYFKNARFSDSAYCGTHYASPGKGWKFYCDKTVEAECYK